MTTIANSLRNATFGDMIACLAFLHLREKIRERNTKILRVRHSPFSGSFKYRLNKKYIKTGAIFQISHKLHS